MGHKGEISYFLLFTKIKTNGKAVLYDERGSSLLGVRSELPLQTNNVAQATFLQSGQGCAVQERRLSELSDGVQGIF